MRLFNLITFLLSLLIFAVFVFLAIDTVRAQPIGEWDPFSIHLDGSNDSSISAEINFPLGLSVPDNESITLGSTANFQGVIEQTYVDFGFGIDSSIIIRSGGGTTSTQSLVLSTGSSSTAGVGSGTLNLSTGVPSDLGGQAGFIYINPGPSKSAFDGAHVQTVGGEARGNNQRAGDARIFGGNATGAGTTDTGGNVLLAGGEVNSFSALRSRGYVKIARSDAGAPSRFSLNSTDTQSSLYIYKDLEVDGTTWLDGNALVGGTLNVTGATTLATSLTGILKGTSGLVAVASSSDLLTAIGTIDISSATNLAASSPILLTGDTVGFDFSTNNTWTGTNLFEDTVTVDSALTVTGNLTVDTNTLLTDATNNSVGIGITPQAGAGKLKVGGALYVDVETNAFGTTSPYTAFIIDGGSVGGGLYAIGRVDPAKEPFTALCGYDVPGTERSLWYGGGGWGVPDATHQYFYAAAAYNETNDAGVLQMTITSAGTRFDNDVIMATTERINFRDTNQYIYSSAASTLDDSANTTRNFRIGGTTEMSISSTLLDIASNDFAIASGAKFYFEGSGGDSYAYYDSGSSSLKFYVNGTLAMELK